MATDLSADSISTTWLLISTVVGLFVVHQLYTFTTLWRRGVPGPMPLPIIGNFMSMLSGLLPVMKIWRETYGPSFGIYQGKATTIITSDVDLAKMITTKEFGSFLALDNGMFTDVKYLRDSLFPKTGPAWKTSRSYMSPTFSGSKMKQMIPLVNDRCDVMLDILEKKQKSGEGFETKKVLVPYVMDCIARCAFGVEADCQRDPNDPFVKHCLLLQDNFIEKPGFILSVMFPALTPFFNAIGLEKFPVKSMDFFADIVKKAYDLRKSGSASGRKDFLQLMIDAAESGGDEEPSTQNGSEDHQVTAKKKVPLTLDELVGQSILFFFAGFDTISTTTGFTLYALAANPEIQTTLQEEIDETIPEGKPVGYDAVFKMEYLDKVWCESMRMYPSAFVMQRGCNKDYSYNGVNIAAGDTVLINNWDILHDSKYWPEPEKFDPERFTKEARDARNPYTYMPFGAGPRNCVGMRFAILKSKMVIIRILQKYTLELLPETPDLTDPSLKPFGTSSLYPDKGIHLRHVPRN